MAIATGLTLGGSVQWWNGPDMSLGYTICRPNTAGNQPNPLNIPAYIGFWRSSALTDTSFIELGNSVQSSQTFERASQVATWALNQGYWPIWQSPVNKILYSGDSYDSYWYSGDTSQQTQAVSVTYEKRPESLRININLNGSGYGYGTWNLVGKFFSNPDYPYSTLRVYLDNQGCSITVYVSDGTNEQNNDSGNGLQNIDVNISSKTGYLECWIFVEKSGTNDYGYVEIYSVETIQENTIATPYPYPNWNNMTLITNPSPIYPFTTQQITGINTVISVSAAYSQTYALLAYKITTTEITNFDSSLDPVNDQGFTFFDASSISVNNGEWLSFSLYSAGDAGSTDVDLTNDTDGVRLDLITITNA